jgi:hypothetical protein
MISMISTRFITSPKEATDGLAALDDAFWEQDTISSKDIDSLAERVAAGIGGICSNDTQLVLYPLEGCEVKAIIRQMNNSDRQTKLVDVTPYASALRSAISDRLAHLLPDMGIIVADHRITSDSARILSTADGRVLKAPMDWSEDRGFKDSEKRKEGRSKAIQLLYSLPERSPFIAYNITHIENGTGPQMGMQVQRKLSVQTLYDVIYRSSEQMPPLSKTLMYLEQTMQGAVFLVDHGLRLTDICPFNITIDQKTDCAFLFDMDSLITSTEPLEGYFTHSGFRPPERSVTLLPTGDKQEVTRPVQEAEMVYEMGITLQELCRKYKLTQSEALELATAMTCPVPEDRLTIREAMQKLKKVQQAIAVKDV